MAQLYATLGRYTVYDIAKWTSLHRPQSRQIQNGNLPQAFRTVFYTLTVVLLECVASRPVIG